MWSEVGLSNGRSWILINARYSGFENRDEALSSSSAIEIAFTARHFDRGRCTCLCNGNILNKHFWRHTRLSRTRNFVVYPRNFFFFFRTLSSWKSRQNFERHSWTVKTGKEDTKTIKKQEKCLTIFFKFRKKRIWFFVSFKESLKSRRSNR